MNCSKLLRLALLSVVSMCALACSDDETADHRDFDYGHVQFRLYKEASYEKTEQQAQPQSRAVVSQLDYLNKATKILVNMGFEGSTIQQTLTLSAADNASAEFGLRSEKLKLLAGEYTVYSYTLYDVNDEPIYIGHHEGDPLLIVAGGLTPYDLTANVIPRGAARFTLYKSNIRKGDYAQSALTRAEGEYTFDEVARLNITVQNKANNRSYTFEGLKMTFSTHFDADNEADGTFGYLTSSSRCDSLLSLPASDYRITSYTLLSSNNTQLDARYSYGTPIPGDFTVEDNKTTDVRVGVNIDLSAEYIADYLALYEIWQALDGPNWYYAGELFARGSNWNFNKDIDLWGDQPGVQLHPNGRVARIDLSDFGARGAVPESLGQLSEMIELYFGTHNDTNLLEYDPTADRSLSISQRSTRRIELNKQYLAARHVAPQMSEPCARGLREHNIVVPETSLYARGFTEAQVIDPRTGLQAASWQLKDVLPGKRCNGITSIPESIGNLTKLEYLYIANGSISELPATLKNLVSLTDLEVYNCPDMKQFPMVLAEMPELISLNISNNSQWDPDDLRDGLAALASGPSREKLQILYCTNNRLKELPAEFNQLTKIGLLDLADNQIEKLYPFGPNVAPVQVYFDNNQIAEFPTENGIFCQMNDMETFSAANNLLTVFPNIFRTNGYTISTIDLSSNRIERFPAKEEFGGVRVTTLTLTNNPIPIFPAVLINNDNSSIAYIVMRACNLSGFEKDAFVGKNSASLQSLDLSYNHLKELPDDFLATNMPYLYGIDLSFNAFSSFPYKPFDAYTLTIYAIRSQRDENGRRCLTEWPTGVYQHTGLRALYLGSNDIRRVNDTISYLIYYLDISDNPNITFDASDICLYWQAGLYNLIYDKTQNILNCSAMLE